MIHRHLSGHGVYLDVAVCDGVSGNVSSAGVTGLWPILGTFVLQMWGR